MATKITIEDGENYAPCCYVLCRAMGKPGHLDWSIRDEKNTVLISTDWDYPAVAQEFGWELPCKCGSSDGTVDCAMCGVTASEMITQAAEYLDDIAGTGRLIEDPGYFE